jgi:hypothetical protein
MTTFMVIERFHADKIKDLYQRFAEKGRMLPEGVVYVNSWIDEDVRICYQLMQSISKEKLEEWVSHWDDLADFEIVTVINSEQAKAKVFVQ